MQLRGTLLERVELQFDLFGLRVFGIQLRVNEPDLLAVSEAVIGDDALDRREGRSNVLAQGVDQTRERLVPLLALLEVRLPQLLFDRVEGRLHGAEQNIDQRIVDFVSLVDDESDEVQISIRRRAA